MHSVLKIRQFSKLHFLFNNINILRGLESLEELIIPQDFFRINRKYRVSLKAITDVVAYSNSRIKPKIQQAKGNDFWVAREKVKAFKIWLEEVG